MNITVAKSAGFCAGVARAVDTAYKMLGESPQKPLATLGQLIHNNIVTDDLAIKGLMIINHTDEIKHETVIIRSHGVTNTVEEKLQQRNIQYIDCTCSSVKAVHRKAQKAVIEGRRLIVLGEASHPEVVGTVSHGGEGVIVADNETDLLNILSHSDNKYTLVAQTTFDTQAFARITNALIETTHDIEIHNTICNATITRQQETLELAKKSDVMIIIGDKLSANTQALYDISTKICPRTILIASIQDLELQYLNTDDKIGVTAGASTPPALTKEAVQFMSEFTKALPAETPDETAAVNPEVTETTESAVDIEATVQPKPQQESQSESFEDMLNESFKPLHSGHVVKGTVIHVTPTEVTVNLGYKSDGIITRQEFTDDATADITQLTKPGDVFDVFVIRVNDGDGNVLVSKKKLDNQVNYKMLEQALADKTVVKGKITEVIKGGLLANVFGCRVFVPSSQVSNRFVDDLTQFKGKEMDLHILELDRSKRRIVAGRKELAGLEAKAKRDALFATIEVGQRIEGVVSRIVDFGAFVDIGGVDGLIHVSEMAWKRVRKVTDVLQVGDQVTVTVIAVDPEKNKISLSLKDINNDPWNGVDDRYPIGSIVDGQVARLAPFGAFVSLEDGIDGLVHISQIANRHIAKPDEVLKVGDIIQVKIMDINMENHRINLSKREADAELGYDGYADEEYYDDEAYDDSDEYYDDEPENAESEVVEESDDVSVFELAEEAEVSTKVEEINPEADAETTAE